MAMQLITPTETVDFQTNKRLLNRYRYIEHETVKLLAGWLPATPHMETKLDMGRLLWEDAQHVQSCYLRLREVQTPAFRPTGDAALEFLMSEAIHAPTAEDFLAGIFRILKPALIQAYRWHTQQTFANPDAPTRYYMRHILMDKEAQVEWGASTLADYPIGEWETYIARLLAAAGGPTGLDARPATPARPTSWREFQAPRVAARDSRFSTDMRFAFRPTEDDVAGQRLAEFQSYAQEVLAAETVALILYETRDMTWEFTYDLARHCYDETRHCRLGIEWLARHGLDYTSVPQNTHIYAWRSQYNAATQYALLTMGNESHVFPYRQKRLDEYKSIGDALSVQFLNYDMADERQHVAFGHKWLPDLIKWQGDDRDVDQFITDTVALWNREYTSGALPIHSSQSTVVSPQ